MRSRPALWLPVLASLALGGCGGDPLTISLQLGTGGLGVLLLALGLGTLVAATEVARSVARLPRPLGAVVVRNASSRILTRCPLRWFQALAVLGVVSVSVNLANRLLDLPEQWRTVGALSDRDQWASRADAVHPDLRQLIATSRGAAMPDGTIDFRAPRTIPSRKLLPRYLSFPARLARGADIVACLTPYPLPNIAQPSKRQFSTVHGNEPAGQTYIIRGNNRYVVALKVTPRGLDPAEHLEALLYATTRGRKIHGRAVSTDGMFRFEPPVLIPGEVNTFFALTLQGSGDGRYQLAVARDDPFDDGIALVPDGDRDTDLAFTLWLSPAGFEPVTTVGQESVIFRRETRK